MCEYEAVECAIHVESTNPDSQRLRIKQHAFLNSFSEEDSLANLDTSANGQDLCTLGAWAESTTKGKCWDVGLKKGIQLK